VEHASSSWSLWATACKHPAASHRGGGLLSPVSRRWAGPGRDGFSAGNSPRKSLVRRERGPDGVIPGTRLRCVARFAGAVQHAPPLSVCADGRAGLSVFFRDHEMTKRACWSTREHQNKSPNLYRHHTEPPTTNSPPHRSSATAALGQRNLCVVCRLASLRAPTAGVLPQQPVQN
jgi:hypothetical protein